MVEDQKCDRDNTPCEDDALVLHISLRVHSLKCLLSLARTESSPTLWPMKTKVHIGSARRQALAIASDARLDKNRVQYTESNPPGKTAIALPARLVLYL